MAGASLPVFVDSSSLGQLHEIVTVIGPPTLEDLESCQHSAEPELAPAAAVIF
jgi:hypothetical protein